MLSVLATRFGRGRTECIVTCSPRACACSFVPRETETRRGTEREKKDWIKTRCTFPAPCRPPPTSHLLTLPPIFLMPSFPTRNYCPNFKTVVGCATVACATSRTIALITFEKCSHPLNLVAPFFAASIRFVARDHGKNTNLSHRCQHRKRSRSDDATAVAVAVGRYRFHC